jgi:hypothetical protein
MEDLKELSLIFQMKKMMKILLNNNMKEHEAIITNIIYQTIYNFVDMYDIPFGAINCGECMNFAEEVYDLLKNEGIEVEILSDAFFCDCFGDLEPDELVKVSEYGSKEPENFAEMCLPSHYWIYYKGKHYDCETIYGVEDMFELPIIKRFCNL